MLSMDYQQTIAQVQLPKWMRTNVIIRNKAVPVVHFSSPVVHSTWQCHLGMAMEILKYNKLSKKFQTTDA